MPFKMNKFERDTGWTGYGMVLDDSPPPTPKPKRRKPVAKRKPAARKRP